MNDVRVSDFTEPTAVIRLTKIRNEYGVKKGRYYKGLENDAQALYEATRSAWSTKNCHKIPLTTLALSAYDGIVLEVYRIEKWQPAYYTTVAEPPEGYAKDNSRIEFVGTIADEAVRNKFKGKYVKHLFKRGDAHPVGVFGV